MSDLLDLSD